MGSARKLLHKKRRIKLQTTPSATAKIPLGKKGEKPGIFLAFRHPMNPFFYNKTRRKAPGLRASYGHRNYYSWNWRRYTLKTREMPMRVFSIMGVSGISEAFKKQKGKTGIDIDLRKENKTERKIAKIKRFTAKDEKSGTIQKKIGKPGKTSRICNEKPAAAAETGISKREKVAETPAIKEKTAKNAEIVHDNKTTPIEVKKPAIQTEKPESAKPVSKSVKAGKNRVRVYKTVATTKTPRTSTFKVHAEDGRRSVGKPPNTSNSDFARVVPSFSLFSISVKLQKMKPEGIIRTVDVKIPKPKTYVKEVKTEAMPKTGETDTYHALNRGEKRLFFQKIASAAAGAIN